MPRRKHPRPKRVARQSSPNADGRPHKFHVARTSPRRPENAVGKDPCHPCLDQHRKLPWVTTHPQKRLRGKPPHTTVFVMEAHSPTSMTSPSGKTPVSRAPFSSGSPSSPSQGTSPAARDLPVMTQRSRHVRRWRNPPSFYPNQPPNTTISPSMSPELVLKPRPSLSHKIWCRHHFPWLHLPAVSPRVAHQAPTNLRPERFYVGLDLQVLRARASCVPSCDPHHESPTCHADLAPISTSALRLRQASVCSWATVFGDCAPTWQHLAWRGAILNGNGSVVAKSLCPPHSRPSSPIRRSIFVPSLDLGVGTTRDIMRACDIEFHYSFAFVAESHVSLSLQFSSDRMQNRCVLLLSSLALDRPRHHGPVIGPPAEPTVPGRLRTSPTSHSQMRSAKVTGHHSTRHRLSHQATAWRWPT